MDWGLISGCTSLIGLIIAMIRSLRKFRKKI